MTATKVITLSVVGVDAVHTLITDDELDPDLATELGERGAEVVTA